MKSTPIQVMVDQRLRLMSYLHWYVGGTLILSKRIKKIKVIQIYQLWKY